MQRLAIREAKQSNKSTHVANLEVEPGRAKLALDGVVVAGAAMAAGMAAAKGLPVALLNSHTSQPLCITTPAQVKDNAQLAQVDDRLKFQCQAFGVGKKRTSLSAVVDIKVVAC